jgi:hypothetical protein
MKVLNFLIWIFFAPGNYVLKKADITIEEDGGILRSFVNMCVWGVLAIVSVVILL